MTLVADRPDPQPLVRPESPRFKLRLMRVLLDLAHERRLAGWVSEAEALEGEAAAYQFVAGVW